MSEMTLAGTCWQIVHREGAQALRKSGEAINPLLFFILVALLFPFALGPKPQLLHLVAPGIVWVAAVLATLLGFERLFKEDFSDGMIDHYLLSPYPLAALMGAKVLAHWLLTGLPLLLATPIIACLYGLTLAQTLALLLSLLLGTPVLSLLGAIGVALTVGLRNSGVLLALLMLPLYVPVLIFGTGASVAVMNGAASSGLFALLAAMLALALGLAPWAIAGALRVGR